MTKILLLMSGKVVKFSPQINKHLTANKQTLYSIMCNSVDLRDDLQCGSQTTWPLTAQSANKISSLKARLIIAEIVVKFSARAARVTFYQFTNSRTMNQFESAMSASKKSQKRKQERKCRLNRATQSLHTIR